jgi:hypothetical protein
VCEAFELVEVSGSYEGEEGLFLHLVPFFAFTNYGLKSMAGIQQNHEMHLAGEEFRLQRLHAFQGSSRFRAFAEEDQCREQAKEIKVLMLASQKGLNWTSLDPQLALALARAARDVMMAEEETAKLKIVECKNLLATLEDTLDDARARVEDAQQQIGSVLSFFDQQGIQVDLRPLHFEVFQDHPHSSDIDSISDHTGTGSQSDDESHPDEDL